ncbi:MAG: hypothetical protein AAF621_02310, partial [Pseudomonadota bacterium]
PEADTAGQTTNPLALLADSALADQAAMEQKIGADDDSVNEVSAISPLTNRTDKAVEEAFKRGVEYALKRPKDAARLIDQEEKDNDGASSSSEEVDLDFRILASRKSHDTERYSKAAQTTTQKKRRRGDAQTGAPGKKAKKRGKISQEEDKATEEARLKRQIARQSYPGGVAGFVPSQRGRLGRGEDGDFKPPRDEHSRASQGGTLTQAPKGIKKVVPMIDGQRISEPASQAFKDRKIKAVVLKVGGKRIERPTETTSFPAE